MRLRALGDESTLEVLALSYRMQRVLNSEHGLTPIKAAVLLLLGSFATQNRSEEVTALSVPEILALLAYSKSNKVKMYYAVKALCEGGNAAYLKREQKGRAYYYSLTAQGIQLIREAVKQAKVFRFEVTQIQVAA
jgi:DNA-binding MarR family transcriptional regulator